MDHISAGRTLEISGFPTNLVLRIPIFLGRPTCGCPGSWGSISPPPQSSKLEEIFGASEVDIDDILPFIWKAGNAKALPRINSFCKFWKNL